MDTISDTTNTNTITINQDENLIQFIEEITLNYKNYFISNCNNYENQDSDDNESPNFIINSYNIIQLYIETFYKNEGSFSLSLRNKTLKIYNGITLEIKIINPLYFLRKNTLINNDNIHEFTVCDINIQWHYTNSNNVRLMKNTIENIFKLNHILNSYYTITSDNITSDNNTNNDNDHLQNYNEENTSLFLDCFIKSVEYIMNKKYQYIDSIKIDYTNIHYSCLLNFIISINSHNVKNHSINIYCIFEYKELYMDIYYNMNEVHTYVNAISYLYAIHRELFILHDNKHFLHYNDIGSIYNFINHLYTFSKEYISIEFMNLFKELLIDHIRIKKVKYICM